MDYAKINSLKLSLEKITDFFYIQAITNINEITGTEAQRLDTFLKGRKAEYYYDYFIEWMIYFFNDDINNDDAIFRNEMRKTTHYMDRDDLVTIKTHRVSFDTINNFISDIPVRLRAMNEFDPSKTMSSQFLSAFELLYKGYITACNKRKMDTVETFLNNLRTLTK